MFDENPSPYSTQSNAIHERKLCWRNGDEMRFGLSSPPCVVFGSQIVEHRAPTKNHLVDFSDVFG